MDVTDSLATQPSIAEILAADVAPRRTARRPRPSRAESGMLDQYLDEVSRSPLLTREQEVAIARRARQGDEAARHLLISRNLRFVVSVARKYQNRGMPLPDLVGEGNIGLVIAAERFDPELGVKFISYAVWWIRQSIHAALARQGRTVRVPLNRAADIARIARAKEALRQDGVREPSAEVLAKATGLTVEVIEMLAALEMAEVRLDAPVEGSRVRSLGDQFQGDDDDVEERLLMRFLAAEVDRALLVLAPRDARVVRLYFGLDGELPLTLEEIGNMIGVTRERVRQLRDRALKRLGEGAVGRALESFAA